MTAVVSQAGIWLAILTVAVAVGVGFLVPVLLELRRSAKRLTSVLTITEQSLVPLLRDVNATLTEMNRVTSDVGSVTDDVRVLSSSIRRVGTRVGELNGPVSVASLGIYAGRAALKVGIPAGLTYLAKNVFGTHKRRPTMSNCESNFSGRTVILSMFLGALAGAAAMLLLAPKVRRETAERVRELSHDVRERASAAVDRAGEEFSSAVSRGRDFVDEKRSAVAAAVAPGAEASARRSH